MLQRPVQSEFAASALVFPGGSVDPADEAPEWAGRTGLSQAAAQDLLGGPGPKGASARALLVAAAREVFEETSVLLGSSQAPLSPSFAEAVEAAGGHVERAGLCYVARWITPEAMPKRYDTAFFAAAMPAGQEATPAPDEIAGLWWHTPKSALAEFEERDAVMLPPTRAALEALRGYESVAAALAGLPLGRDLGPVLPRLVAGGPGREAGEIQVVMPGEPGYVEE